MSSTAPLSQPSDHLHRKASSKKENGEGAIELVYESRSQIREINSKTLKEAEAHGLDPVQWLDLFHMVEALGIRNPETWINEVFEFKKDGKIRANGGLKFINRPDLARLPNNLIVTGPFRAMLCENLTHLPKGLEVTEGLWISGSGVVEIPDDLKLNGNLNAVRCPSLKSVSNLHYRGLFFLTHCPSLNSLPEGFHADNAVFLDHSAIRTLPKGMKTKQLSLVGCPIGALPDDLAVDGNLILSDNVKESIKTQATTLKNKGQIKGRIVYRETSEKN